jgi:hypothetical protein
MSLLSAWSISLDSTFNKYVQNIKHKTLKPNTEHNQCQPQQKYWFQSFYSNILNWVFFLRESVLGYNVKSNFENILKVCLKSFLLVKRQRRVELTAENDTAERGFLMYHGRPVYVACRAGTITLCQSRFLAPINCSKNPALSPYL